MPTAPDLAVGPEYEGEGAPFRGQHARFGRSGPEGTLCCVAWRVVMPRQLPGSSATVRSAVSDPAQPDQAQGPTAQLTRCSHSADAGQPAASCPRASAGHERPERWAEAPAAPSSPGVRTGTWVAASPGSRHEGFCGQSHAKSRREDTPGSPSAPGTSLTPALQRAAGTVASAGRGARGCRPGADACACGALRDAQEKRPRSKLRNWSESLPHSRDAPHSALGPKAMACALAFRGTVLPAPTAAPGPRWPCRPSSPASAPASAPGRARADRDPARHSLLVFKPLESP